MYVYIIFFYFIKIFKNMNFSFMCFSLNRYSPQTCLLVVTGGVLSEHPGISSSGTEKLFVDCKLVTMTWL